MAAPGSQFPVVPDPQNQPKPAVHPQNQGMVDLSNQLNAPPDPNRQPLNPAPPINTQAYTPPDRFGPTSTVPFGSMPQVPPLAPMAPAKPVDYADQARTQFNLPTSAGSGATPNLAGGGASFGGAAVRPVGGRPTFVDAQPNTFDFRNRPSYPKGVQPRSPGLAGSSGGRTTTPTGKNAAGLTPMQALQSSRDAALADAKSGNPQTARGKVTANAIQRQTERRERIAAKKNPQLASQNRFFSQEQQMQGLRNQGALGVAQENAKGDIARNEAQAALGIAGINARREAEGLKPVGGSTPGEAAPSIPGTEGTPVANNRPVQDAVAEAVKNGDPAAAEAALTGAGVEKNKARQIVQNMAPLPTPTEKAWNDLVSQPFSDLGAYALGGFVKPDVPAPARLAPGKLTVDSLQDQEGDNPAQKAARARLRKRYPGVASQGLLPGQK
jgi:hypothetical protein